MESKSTKRRIMGNGGKICLCSPFIHFAVRQNFTFTPRKLHLGFAQTSLRIAELHLRVSEAVYGKGVVKQPSFSFDVFTLKRSESISRKPLAFHITTALPSISRLV